MRFQTLSDGWRKLLRKHLGVQNQFVIENLGAVSTMENSDVKSGNESGEVLTAVGRTIELGHLRIHLDEEEETVTVLQSLARYLSNQETAEILGVSERTVRRWKRKGRLRCGENMRLSFADLLLTLTRNL